MAKHPHKWQNPTGLNGWDKAELQPSSTKGDLHPKASTEKPPEPQQISLVTQAHVQGQPKDRQSRQRTELRTSPGSSVIAELCRAALSSSYSIGKYPHGPSLGTVQISPSYTGFYDALWAQGLV